MKIRTERLTLLPATAALIRLEIGDPAGLAAARSAVRVFADTAQDNQPSIRLLERLLFIRIGDGAEAGTLRFEIERRSVPSTGGEP